MKTTALTSLQELEVLPHLTIPTNLVDRRTKYYSQHSLLVRTHQSFYLCTNTRFGHLRNNSSTFTKRLNFLWFLNLMFFIVFLYYYYYYCIINFTSLFSYSCSYPLYFPSSCTTIHCFPSHLLFLPLLIHSFPHIHLPLLSFPNLSSHYDSLLHTHHPLTSQLYQLYTTPSTCNT
jgi:hypothetical protein